MELAEPMELAPPLPLDLEPPAASLDLEPAAPLETEEPAPHREQFACEAPPVMGTPSSSPQLSNG